MKYNTVQIRPSSNGNWECYFQSDEVDRYNIKTYPNKIGFFHYPYRMSKSRAFSKLKTLLIFSHKREIERLQESLNKLEMLEIP